MTDYFYLIPIALGIGLPRLRPSCGRSRSGQYDDLEGAAERILHEESDAPIRESNEGAITATGAQTGPAS
jgi:cbb3-type cytochrome oxidase maturation protein